MRGFLRLPSYFIFLVLFSNLLVSSGLSKQESNSAYVLNDNDIIFDFLKKSIDSISADIYEKTCFRFIVNVVKETTLGASSKISDVVSNNDISYQDKFRLRREHEDRFLSSMQGNYAVLFLFYNDHYITLKSNVDFLDTNFLLDEYAYPYLPATSIQSNEYQDGVNTGLYNVYLAAAHAIASHYGIALDIRKPMQRPSEGVRSVIYVMLFSLVSLFLLVYFGFFGKAKDKIAK